MEKSFKITKQENILSCKNHVKRKKSGKRPNNVPQKVFIHWHGDASGSMSSMGNSPYLGAKDFVEKQCKFSKENKLSDIYLTFETFSNNGNIIYQGDPANITDEQILQCADAMKPTQMTKLYDTVISAIENQKKQALEKYNLLPKISKKLISFKEYCS